MAQYDYYQQTDDDLSFGRGELLLILNKLVSFILFFFFFLFFK